jgi:hypothetical protein
VAGRTSYLFDREAGQMRRRLTGLANVVRHLAFSPDGRFMAATLGGASGLRVYETSGWQAAQASQATRPKRTSQP